MNLVFFVAPACAAALISYALAPVAAWIAVRLGAMDQPGPRKVHHRPVPRLGGLAVIVAALLVAFPTFWWLPADRRVVLGPMCLGVLLGLVPIVAVSIIDDIRTLSARPKFLMHLIGATIAVSFGVSLNSEVHLFGQTVTIGVLAFPLSVLWMVGVTNAFNIVDGLDGLSAGLALISAASLAGVFALAGQGGMAAAVLVLAGSLGGFLPHNIYPARMFLGDTGATAVGFCLAAFALRGGATLSAGFATLLPIFALGMPIAETGISMARRMLRRLDHHDAGGVFEADRNHMHHRLLALGIDHARAVFILYAAGAVLACAALLSMSMTARESALLLVALLLAGVLGVRRLGYDEFAVIRNGTALRVYEAPVFKKSMFVVFVDLINVAIAVYCAVGLKTDDWGLMDYRASTFAMVALVAPITVTVFSKMGLYRGNWRLAGIEDFTRACGAVLVAALLGLTACMLLAPEASPSLFAIYALIALVLVTGSRASYQILAASQGRARSEGEPALIYGAGRKGSGALRELLFDIPSPLRPVAFIDDDPAKAGKLLNGIPIVGSIHALEASVRRFAARAVIVATDAIPEARLTHLRELCDRLGVSLLRMQITFDPCVALPAGAEARLNPWQSTMALAASRSVEPAFSFVGRVSGPAAQQCQKCRSHALHRSHAKTTVERIRKRLTRRRLYRCDACGWRGWTGMRETAVFEPGRAMLEPFPILESVDAVLQ